MNEATRFLWLSHYAGVYLCLAHAQGFKITELHREDQGEAGLPGGGG
jgi:hypothetical protein